jgi:hypothetical protein
MAHNSLQYKHLRINILARFYLFLALFHLCALLMFSTNLMILGKVIIGARAMFVHIFFVTLLLYLFWIVRKAKKRAFWTALTLHSCFLANGLLLYLKKIPLFDIQGRRSTHFSSGIESIALFIVAFNALIIIYYIYIHEYFVDNR